MEDYVALIDQLGSERMVVNRIDRVMKTRMTLEMLNVFDGAGGKIVDHVNFIAALDVSVAEMRADKTCATCNQYSQIVLLIFATKKQTKSKQIRRSITLWCFLRLFVAESVLCLLVAESFLCLFLAQLFI